MAVGVVGQTGAVAAPADLDGAGVNEWSQVTGIDPGNPLVGGAAAGYTDLPYDVDSGRSRIATLPRAEGGDGGAPAHAPEMFDDWRDLFDFQNSPVPYIFLFFAAAVGFIALRVDARGGPASASVRLGD